MTLLTSPRRFNAPSIGGICALLSLSTLLGQPAFAGTITFSDSPNDVASDTISGFGTPTQGMVLSNVCAPSGGSVTGSAWQCTVVVTNPAGATFSGGGPFAGNFYEGAFLPANLEATESNTCNNSGCTFLFTTDNESGTLAPIAGVNYLCLTAPSTVCTNIGSSTPFP